MLAACRVDGRGGAQARPPAKPPDYVWVPSDDEGDEAGGGAGDGAGEEGNAAAGGDDVAAAAAVTATAVPLVVPKALLLSVTHSKSGSLSADTTFRVTREGASIGRTSDCDVRVAAPRVSKSHAVIMFQQSWGFYIADCGRYGAASLFAAARCLYAFAVLVTSLIRCTHSNNGTTLEGVRLSEARKSSGWVYLRDGSSFSIAEDTTFHVAFDLADSGGAAGAAAGAATPARPPRRRNKRRHDDAIPATTKTNTSMLGAPASASSSAAPSAASTAADASKYESNLKRQRGGGGAGLYRDRAAERRARHPGHDDTEFMTEEARAASGGSNPPLLSRRHLLECVLLQPDTCWLHGCVWRRCVLRCTALGAAGQFTALAGLPQGCSVTEAHGLEGRRGAGQAW